MKNFEAINELKNTLTSEPITTEEYLKIEKKLVDTIYEAITDAEVTSTNYGEGKITKFEGDTFDSIIVDITFEQVTKTFSLQHIVTKARVVKLNDTEIKNLWTEAFDVHTTATNNYKAFKDAEEKARIEAEKKAEEERLAEAKYQKAKAKNIKDFELLTTKGKTPLNDSYKFYYDLGWLVKHIGTVSAALPDYLAKAFAKYFGEETPCRIVDSKKRGPAGWQSQWSWSFNLTLKKPDEIPAAFTKYLNPSGKAITNTSFIWDLIDNYGFQFGKTQDVDKILAAIPAKYHYTFNLGFENKPLIK